MKIVSPKTFIVSLLLGILVLYKVLSIDGFTDILWISLMGYWNHKGNGGCIFTGVGCFNLCSGLCRVDCSVYFKA